MTEDQHAAAIMEARWIIDNADNYYCDGWRKKPDSMERAGEWQKRRNEFLEATREGP